MEMITGLFAKSVKVFAALFLVFGVLGFAGGKASADVPKGAVYTLTNSATGNAVAVFDRDRNGLLTPAGMYPTGGRGTGAGLGSQGAVIFSNNTKWLFAVNAGSNDISVFSVDPVGLTFIDRESSGGSMPISLTVHKDVLYALNAGGAGSITGFNVMGDGTLVPIPGSTRPLSGSGTGPAQVQFSPNGRVLVVTEKNTNLIDTYTVDKNGIASGPTSYPSSGATPFGFTFIGNDTIVVSEAHGGPAGSSAVSSYAVSPTGALSIISGSAQTHQNAACWVVATRNGQYAYSTNAGSGSLSGFGVDGGGNLNLLTPDGRTGVTGDGSTPIDAAVNNNSHYLYALLGGAHGIAQFEIQPDGSLVNLGTVPGLPAGDSGLAAR
jgi:6-phosphogluconolactonase